MLLPIHHCYANILVALEDSKNHALGKLEEVSKLYTKRDADSEHIPHHPYTLRGVCSNPKTIYVLEKTRPEVEDDMLSAEAKDWQWWKITYVGSDSKPVSEKVSLPLFQLPNRVKLIVQVVLLPVFHLLLCFCY